MVETQKALESELRSSEGVTEAVDEKLAVARKEERLHRLRMAMMASLSAVPFALLPEYLAEVKRALSQAETMEPQEKTTRGQEKGPPLLVGSNLPSKTRQPGKKEELVHNLYLEAVERVGDREKELVIGWWYENLEFLGRGLGTYRKGEVKPEPLAHRAIAGGEAGTLLARL